MDWLRRARERDLARPRHGGQLAPRDVLPGDRLRRHPRGAWARRDLVQGHSDNPASQQDEHTGSFPPRLRKKSGWAQSLRYGLQQVGAVSITSLGLCFLILGNLWCFLAPYTCCLRQLRGSCFVFSYFSGVKEKQRTGNAT